MDRSPAAKRYPSDDAKITIGYAMPIYDIFSKRKARAEAKDGEIYTYDSLPDTLKMQIVQIWNSVLGVPHDTPSSAGEHGPVYTHRRFRIGLMNRAIIDSR